LRYILFVLLGAVSIILPGSVFSFANIGGIVPDILLVTALCIVFLEKTSASILYAGITGIVFDVMFAPYVGFNALAYVITVAIAYAILRNMARMRLVYLAAVGFAAYIAKELILAAVVGLTGIEFDFLYMFVRYILPGAFVSSVLMYLAYYVIRILYTRNWMTPTKSLYDDFLE
jgi:rod shape-determining protein MreD